MKSWNIISIGLKNILKLYEGKDNENGFSEKVYSIIIDYDSDRDETTISRDGEVITTGGGNHFDAYLETYVKDGWKPSMSPS